MVPLVYNPQQLIGERPHRLYIHDHGMHKNNLVPFRDQIQDFLYAAIVRAIHQAAEMEAAMELHQERMKDVCYSIKAHYHWDNFGVLFPEFSIQCKSSGENISPEFDRGRHMGLCT